MKQLLRWVIGKKNKKRQVVGWKPVWMKDQLLRMNKMNQEVISMSLGKV